jgi:hypothetical protein
MKTTRLSLLCLMAATFYFSARHWTMSNSGGAVPSRTGAPLAGGGNELTCQACHGGSLNTGTNPVTLTIDGNPQTFQPNQVYDMTVTYGTPGNGGHGFQIVALNPQLASVGTFVAGVGNQVISGGGRQYVTHSSGGNTSWSFKWTAPDILPASVSFYAVSANRGGGPSRTFTLNRTVLIEPTSVSGVNEKEAISLFPFDVEKDLTISSGSANNPILSWVVVDQMGRSIAQSEDLKVSELEKVSLPTGMRSGIYNVLIQTPTGRVTKRFFKN